VRQSVNERELALDILLSVTKDKVFSHIAINQVLSKHQDLEKHKRGFISHLVEGTLERLLEIDYIINRFSNTPTQKMKPTICNIIRMGVYQLKYMENIPQAAVCNEAVKLAKKRGFANLSGFVNGNLRAVARDLDNVTYPRETIPRMEIKYSIPAWIIEMWLESYPIDIVEQIAKSFHEKKSLTIRTNLSKITTEELKEKILSELCKEKECSGKYGKEHQKDSSGGALKKVNIIKHLYLPYALKLSGIDHVSGLDSFKDGDFYIQDVSSMLVGELASVREDDYVVDLCAAPGGKSLHVADKMQFAAGVRDWRCKENISGLVDARDLTDRKVALILENVNRSGFDNVKVSKKDATILDETILKKADIVIADVPCSGLGVLGRKPDLRYNVSPNVIDELVVLQRKILSNASAYVKPGGSLIFSTCTISPKENMENVYWLLESFPKLELVAIDKELTKSLKSAIIEKGCLQLLPGIHDCDGFFIAKFRFC